MNEKSNVNETLYQHAFFENYYFDNLEEKEFPGILKQINDTGKYKLDGVEYRRILKKSR